jgi:aminodeoxyfutalosine deaminase
MSFITNAHTHLELNWLADHCPKITGAPFAAWSAGLVERRWEIGDQWEQVYEAAVEDGILELLSAGTTHVGDITLSGKSIGPLLSSGLQGVVYVELLGLDSARVDHHLEVARKIIDEWRPQERNGMQVGLSIHAPYSVHPDLWRKALDYARREALPLCIHAAESAAELDFLTMDTGPLVDEFYLSLKLQPVPFPRATPIRFLEDIGALDLHPALVHGVHVNTEDIMRIAAHDCTVIHCPRSNLRLQNGRMPLEDYLRAGVTVYLGTESRAASPSLDILGEMEIAAALHQGRVSPQVFVEMVQQPFPPRPSDA